MNHPERIAFGSGSMIPVLFGSPYSMQDIQSIVSHTLQEKTTIFSLATSLQIVVNAVGINSNSTISTSAVVFMSDTTAAANLDGAQKYADILKNKNVRITLILMGNKVNSTVLTNITSNFVTWSDLSQQQPENWGNLFGPTLGCSGGVSTVGSTVAVSTTTFQPESTTGS
ncbi:hypothetical protein FO519_010335, partial [Halicephalobus sp. NKZ332]